MLNIWNIVNSNLFKNSKFDLSYYSFRQKLNFEFLNKKPYLRIQKLGINVQNLKYKSEHSNGLQDNQSVILLIEILTP